MVIEIERPLSDDEVEQLIIEELSKGPRTLSELARALKKYNISIYRVRRIVGYLIEKGVVRRSEHGFELV